MFSFWIFTYKLIHIYNTFLYQFFLQMWNNRFYTFTIEMSTIKGKGPILVSILTAFMKIYDSEYCRIVSSCLTILYRDGVCVYEIFVKGKRANPIFPFQVNCLIYHGFQQYLSFIVSNTICFSCSICLILCFYN